MLRILAITLGALICLPAPATASVDCTVATSLVCTDGALAELNAGLAAREALLKRAPMHQAFRAELEAANTEWEEALDDCAAAANATACYRKRLEQRIAVLDLLKRLFAGPHLPTGALLACRARGGADDQCYESLFAAADTVYALTARAFETSLAAVDIQSTTAPDGGADAATAEQAFRAWRTAECTALSRSPMIRRTDTGGIIACQISLTWKELATLAQLLGRQPHWSERVLNYAPSFRACFDKGREEDVDLRVIDVFTTEAGEIIRLMGSRGRYDCGAVGETVSTFEPAEARMARPGEAEAIFIPVQGQRPWQGVLDAPGGTPAKCYETQALIAAEARLSGWVAVSLCN